MTKKKINIILLLFVVGLWGTVAYRSVSQYLYKQEVVYAGKDSIFALNRNMRKKDTFEMTALTRDPFLNRSFPTNPKTILPPIARSSVKPKTAPIVPTAYFPMVEYFGYIKSSRDVKSELVMIKSDGVLMKLKLGEERNGLKVLKVFKDSIQFSFNKKTRYVRKNQ